MAGSAADRLRSLLTLAGAMLLLAILAGAPILGCASTPPDNDESGRPADGEEEPIQPVNNGDSGEGEPAEQPTPSEGNEEAEPDGPAEPDTGDAGDGEGEPAETDTGDETPSDTGDASAETDTDAETAPSDTGDEASETNGSSGTAADEIDAADLSLLEEDPALARLVYPLPRAMPDAAAAGTEPPVEAVVAKFRAPVPTDPAEEFGWLTDCLRLLAEWRDSPTVRAIGVALRARVANGADRHDVLRLLIAQFHRQWPGTDDTLFREAGAEIERLATTEPADDETEPVSLAARDYAELLRVGATFPTDSLMVLRQANDDLKTLLERRPGFLEAIRLRIRIEQEFGPGGRERALELARQAITIPSGDHFEDVLALGLLDGYDPIQEYVTQVDEHPIAAIVAARIGVEVARTNLVPGPRESAPSGSLIDVARTRSERLLEVSAAVAEMEPVIPLSPKRESILRIGRHVGHLTLSELEITGEPQNWDAAMTQFEQAMQLEPRNLDAYRGMIQALQYHSRQANGVGSPAMVEATYRLTRLLQNAVEESVTVETSVILVNYIGVTSQFLRQWEQPMPSLALWRGLAESGDRMRRASAQNEIDREFHETWGDAMSLLVAIEYPSDRSEPGYPVPLPPDAMADVPAEDVEMVIGYLLVAAKSDAFSVRSNAIHWLGLLVRATGVEKEAVLGNAVSILRQPLTDNRAAEQERVYQVRLVATIGDDSVALDLVDLMDRYLANANLQLARDRIELLHVALRAIVDPGHSPDFQFDFASAERLTDLVDSWRDKIQ